MLKRKNNFPHVPIRPHDWWVFFANCPGIPFYWTTLYLHLVILKHDKRAIVCVSQTKTNVLRVKYEIICTVKNISLNFCKELLGTKSCLYHNNQRRLTCSWKKEYRKKITCILTTILNSIHDIWLDVLNDHVFTYFFKDQPYF